MKKEVKIAIVVVLVLVLALIGYFASKSWPSSPNGQPGQSGTQAGVPADMLKNQNSEAAKATQALINDSTNGQGTVQTINIPNSAATTTGSTTALQQMKVVVVSPGTSGIDTKTGQVVTQQGVEVDNSAKASSASAPQSSFPIDPKSAPSSSIKLAVTMSSFTPNTFTVNRGQAVSLVISNVNTSTFSEVFRFDDPSLSAVAVGLAKGETKSITFNAPDKAGEYTFYSSMFNHRDLGAVGKMIVK